MYLTHLKSSLLPRLRTLQLINLIVELDPDSERLYRCTSRSTAEDQISDHSKGSSTSRFPETAVRWAGKNPSVDDHHSRDCLSSYQPHIIFTVVTNAMRVAITAWLIWYARAALASKEDASSSATSSAEDLSQCGLYMAPSSTGTPSEPAWGLYAGKDFQPYDLIGHSEVGVNLLNFKVHAGFEDDDEFDPEDYDDAEAQMVINEVVSFVESFMWVPEPAGARFETTTGRTITYIPGTGVLSAMNEKLTNAQWNHRNAYFPTNILGEEPGVAHPGRGAQTPFYSAGIQAGVEIARGSEIFLSYGANYAGEDPEDLLQRQDYEKLDETIKTMIGFFEKHKDNLDDTAKAQVYEFLIQDVMTAAVGTKRQTAIERIMPEAPEDLQSILDVGGSMQFDKKTAFRSMEWLQEKGFCADNLRAGSSTVPHAGRGALATRAISAGSLVAATPLIHVPTGIVMKMYELEQSDDGKDDYIRISDEVVGSQLLLNYCFGHPNSTMLFLPAGPGVSFINHSNKPNAKMQWSNHSLSRTDWFQVDPLDMTGVDNFGFMGMVMEVVATEDIQPGDEVLIDYGPEWANAWEAHTEEWKQRHTDAWPRKALDFMAEYQAKPFPIEAESQEPYSEDVALMAFMMVKESTAAGTLDDPKQWDRPVQGTVFDAENLFEVSIVDRLELRESYNYTIRWLNVRGDATYVEKVPHDAFVLVDMPETSDHFEEKGFRHPIGIPDDVFPQGPWRNLLNSEKDDEDTDEGEDDEEEDDEDDEEEELQ